ncbi:MAG: cobalamin biosynthesis protein, partial [Phycicoccus sp.]
MAPGSSTGPSWATGVPRHRATSSGPPRSRVGWAPVLRWSLRVSQRRSARGLRPPAPGRPGPAGLEAEEQPGQHDPDGLDEDEIARAVVESVAENTSDAVVAPLVWGALVGVPGLLGYRAANTLDAMVGHRS